MPGLDQLARDYLDEGPLTGRSDETGTRALVGLGLAILGELRALRVALTGPPSLSFDEGVPHDSLPEHWRAQLAWLDDAGPEMAPTVRYLAEKGTQSVQKAAQAWLAERGA